MLCLDAKFIVQFLYKVKPMNYRFANYNETLGTSMPKVYLCAKHAISPSVIGTSSPIHSYNLRNVARFVCFNYYILISNHISSIYMHICYAKGVKKKIDLYH